MNDKPTDKEIVQQQQRLASVLQFDPATTICPACGELIYPVDTLPCRDVPNCAATMGRSS
jgi:hypothetical protein